MNPDNLATQWLVQLFGAGAVLGSDGGTTPLIVQISAFFATYLYSMILLVFAYILVVGVVNTATDGEFLGRQWHSIATPSMAVVAMALLAPMPNAGMTVSQYVYVRGLVKGSEAADKLWAYSARVATQPQSIGGGSIPDYAQSSLPSFIAQRACGDRLREDNMLPEQVESVCGDFSSPDAWKTQSPKMQDVAACFEASYQKLVSDKMIVVPKASEGGRMGRVIFDPKIGNTWRKTVGGLDPNAAGYQYTKDSVSACMYEAAAKWEPALARHDQEDAMVNLGWAAAGKQVLPLKEALQKTSVALKEPVPWPVAARLGETPFGKLETVTVAAIMVDLRNITGTTRGIPDGYDSEKSWLHGVETGATSYAGPGGAMAIGKGIAADERSAAFAKKVGRKSLAYVTRVGGALAGALRGFKSAEAAAGATAAIPIVGAGVSQLAKGAMEAAAVFVLNPVVFNALLLGALFLSNADILPMAGMAVAQIIWVAMAAVWFLILPVGAVLLALPGVSHGKQMLRESLTIVLYPVLLIMFFIAGQFVLDIGITIASAALLDNFSFDLVNIVDLMAGLVTGETVIRLGLFIIILLGMFAGLLTWMIKGPLWAARQMGLGHDHLDMGIDPMKVSQMPGLR